MTLDAVVTRGHPTFEQRAPAALADSQLRHNLRNATGTIRRRRAAAVGEMPDWQALREAGRAIKERTLRHLDHYLLQLEVAVERAGGQVHWARDGDEANAIVVDIVRRHGETAVVKSKSITSEETGLDAALSAAGITATETDLAELIVQLAHDTPSHILVPAIHFNRAQIRELFIRELGVPGLSDRPADLAEAARVYLRRKFLETRIGITGANFAVAETGTVCVVESEGNGRMVATLPDVLITLAGIEKVVPTWRDLEVFLQLLPRSSTAERMNPYNSFWTGVTEGDGPREFHLVLLDNGRTDVLRDEVGRQALRCIRCSACLNVCPVYSRVGGHAYDSVYPGPIGAILTPQLRGLAQAGSLPWASSLCGACYEVCPVMINIPEALVHLRGRVVREGQDARGLRGRLDPENVAMQAVALAFGDARRFEAAQRLLLRGAGPVTRAGAAPGGRGPLAAWTTLRDLPDLPGQTFRDWWRENR